MTAEPLPRFPWPWSRCPADEIEWQRYNRDFEQAAKERAHAAEIADRPLLPVIVNLWAPTHVCAVCEHEFVPGSPTYGVPLNEGGEIVPDDFTGEWGGMAACKRCYLLVRGWQSEYPGEMVDPRTIRELIACAPTA